MRVKRLLFYLFLSVALTVTFIPSTGFALDEPQADDGTQVVQDENPQAEPEAEAPEAEVPEVDEEAGDVFHAMNGEGEGEGNELGQGEEPRMWFECDPEYEGNWRVFSDGEFTSTLVCDNLQEGAEIDYYVVGFDKQGVEVALDSGTHYVIDSEEQEVTLDGGALSQASVTDVGLRATATVEGTGIVCGTYDVNDPDDWCYLSVVEPIVENPYHHRDMLPGEDEWINGYENMFVKNGAHPDGEWIDFEVTGVAVTGGADLIGDGLDKNGKLERQGDDEGFGFRFRIKNSDEINDPLPADVTLKVSYETIGDENDESFVPENGDFEFTATVNTAKYEANMWSVQNIYQGLPGDKIDLEGTANKEYLDDEGDPDETAEGLVYHWEIVSGSEYVETPITEDGNTAQIELALPDGQHHGEINMKMWVSEESDPTDAECASAYNTFWVSDEYYQIEPADVEGLVNLDVGDSVTYAPEVWKYELNKKPVKQDDVYFEWSKVDDSCVDIKEGNPKGTYVITRKGDWNTNFRLEACSSVPGGWGTDQWYHMNGKDYRMEFTTEDDEEEAVVYSDGDFTYTLETEDLPEGAKINYRVIRGNGGSLTKGTHYEINEAKKTVTLNGAALADDSIRFVKLRATATYKGTELCRTFGEEDNDRDWETCEVRPAVVDYHYDDYEMLPGQMDWIDGQDEMYVENSAYPEGEDIPYEVTGVKVTKGANLIGEGLDKDGKTLKKNEDEEGFWYNYRIKELDEIAELGVELPKPVEFEVSYRTVGDGEGFVSETGSFTFTVSVVLEVYEVHISSDDGNYDGLPGDSFNVRAIASHKYVDKNGEQQEDTEGLTYKWYYAVASDNVNDEIWRYEPEDDDWTAVPEAGVTNHKIFGLTTDQNAEGEPTAHLEFKALPEGLDEDSVFLKVEVLDGGKVKCSGSVQFWESDNYCSLLPQQIDGIESLDLGQTKPITAKVQHRWVDNNGVTQESVINNVKFFWEYDPTVVTVTDADGEVVGNYNGDNYNGSPKSTGSEVEFTIERIGAGESDIILIAEWDDGSEEPEQIKEHFRVNRIENDLSDYRVKFKNSNDGWRLFGNYANGDFVFANLDKVKAATEVVCGDYVLDPNNYELKVIYNDNPVDAIIYHGTGQSSYMVIAEAKDGTAFSGQTEGAWIDICSNTSLAGADVTFAKDHKGFPLHPMCDYYWFKVGENAQPTVTIDGGEPLRIGTDITVTYVDEDGNKSDVFPNKVGEYVCQVEPADDSGYEDFYDRTIVMVMTEKEMADAEAAVEEVTPFVNKANRNNIFDENCPDDVLKELRASYDKLSRAAKSWVPSNIQWALHENTGCLWDDGVVTKQATCTENGEKLFTCTYVHCNYDEDNDIDGPPDTKTEVIPALKHKLTHKTQAGGLLTDGTEWDECDRCGVRLNVISNPELGYANSYVKSLKVKKAKKAFTVKWKKQSKKNLKKFNGYQIRYALNQNELDNAKIWNVGKKKKSKKFKVAAKTSYVVQIRTFTVSGGNTYYSDWKTKTVKTK